MSTIISIVGGNWEWADEHSIMGGEIYIMCVALLPPLPLSFTLSLVLQLFDPSPTAVSLIPLVIPPPTSPLASQLAIAFSLLVFSILTFLLGMLSGALTYRHWSATRLTKDHTPDPTYLPMVSNTGITGPLSRKDTSVCEEEVEGYLHDSNTGITGLLRKDTSVCEEEVEGYLYDNIVHHETTTTPEKPLAVLRNTYKNVQLKKHSTDTEICMRNKALSCANLFDEEELKPWQGKSCSLQILSFPTAEMQSKRVHVPQHQQTAPEEEQLYEDIDAIMPCKSAPLPASQLKYDYVSSLRVDWRGSMEKLCDGGNRKREGGNGGLGSTGHLCEREGKVAKQGSKLCGEDKEESSKLEREGKIPMNSEEGQSQHSLGSKDVTKVANLSSLLEEPRQQDRNTEESPLLTSNYGYEIFQLEVESVKRAKVKPPTPIKPATLARNTLKSKVHCHGDRNITDAKLSDAQENDKLFCGNIEKHVAEPCDSRTLEMETSMNASDGRTLREYSNVEIQEAGTPGGRRVEIDAPLKCEVGISHRGRH